MVEFMSRREATKWCTINQVSLDQTGLPDCADPEQKFDIPVDAQKRVQLVRAIMQEFSESRSLLVWLDDWMVWESGQWMPLFSRLRLSYGETRRLIEAPAQLFSVDQIEDATSFVVASVLFLFDCYIVCPQQRRIVMFSHDEWGVSKKMRTI
ncbi:hypothetical protein [Bradyrhizobium sp. HKCCYLS20291]|uniref:hypothetical protein n=1 Tax=Bradyrhizobium sp. HKCCYLS20291 TaxID=3420766 RepID=UPI003EBB92F1